MNRFCRIAATLATAGSLLLGQSARPADVQWKAAQHKEEIEGDIKGAIEAYRKIAQSTDRGLAAKALVRMGQCYEKMGDAEARKAYERVLASYADQPDAVREARTRLDASRSHVSSHVTLRRVWSGPGVNTFGRVSPDGRYLSFTHWGNGDLAIRDLSSGETRLVTHMPNGNTDGVETSVWSPDGKRIAYAFETKTGYQIRLINIDGSGMRTLFQTTEDRSVEPNGWSPDGKRILTVAYEKNRRTRLFWLNAADGAIQPITLSFLRLPEHSNALNHLHLSPDGRYIAFTSPSKFTPNGAVRIMPVDGSREIMLSGTAVEEFPVGWSPDSKQVLFASARAGNLGIWSISLAGDKPQGPPRMIIRDVGGLNIYGMGVTRSGALHYAIRTGASDIYTASMDPATGKVTSEPAAVPLSRTGHNTLPTWSPDGTQILFTWFQPSTQSTLREISVFSPATRQERRIPSRVTLGGAPWCWHGSEFVLARSERGGTMKLNVHTGEATLLFEGFQARSCSQDLVADVRSSGIMVKRIDNGVETLVHKFSRNPGAAIPFLSHNGRNVAFVARTDEGSALNVAPTNGGPARELARVKFPAAFQTVRGLTWSPDDRFLYFLRKKDGTVPFEMFRIPVEGGREEAVGLKGEVRDMDISPDGARIAFSLGDLQQPEVWAVENPLTLVK